MRLSSIWPFCSIPSLIKMLRELQFNYQEWLPKIQKSWVVHCLACSQASSGTVKPCRLMQNLWFPLDIGDIRYYETYNGNFVLFQYTVNFYLDKYLCAINWDNHIKYIAIHKLYEGGYLVTLCSSWVTVRIRMDENCEHRLIVLRVKFEMIEWELCLKMSSMRTEALWTSHRMKKLVLIKWKFTQQSNNSCQVNSTIMNRNLHPSIVACGIMADKNKDLYDTWSRHYSKDIREWG